MTNLEYHLIESLIAKNLFNMKIHQLPLAWKMSISTAVYYMRQLKQPTIDSVFEVMENHCFAFEYEDKNKLIKTAVQIMNGYDKKIKICTHVKPADKMIGFGTA